MSRKTGLDSFTILGALTLALWVVGACVSIERGGFSQLFWYCDLATLMTAIGILARNPMIVSAQLVGIAVYHLAWHVDYVSYLLFGAMPLAATTYMHGAVLSECEKALSFLQHTWVVPVAVWTVHRLGCCSRAWIVQSVQTASIFLATYLFTGRGEAVNWFFGPRLAGLCPSKSEPLVYYALMTAIPILFIYRPMNRLLSRAFPERTLELEPAPSAGTRSPPSSSPGRPGTTSGAM